MCRTVTKLQRPWVESACTHTHAHIITYICAYMQSVKYANVSLEAYIRLLSSLGVFRWTMYQLKIILLRFRISHLGGGTFRLCNVEFSTNNYNFRVLLIASSLFGGKNTHTHTHTIIQLISVVMWLMIQNSMEETLNLVALHCKFSFQLQISFCTQMRHPKSHLFLFLTVRSPIMIMIIHQDLTRIQYIASTIQYWALNKQTTHITLFSYMVVFHSILAYDVGVHTILSSWEETQKIRGNRRHYK